MRSKKLVLTGLGRDINASTKRIPGGGVGRERPVNSNVGVGVGVGGTVNSFCLTASKRPA